MRGFQQKPPQRDHSRQPGLGIYERRLRLQSAYGQSPKEAATDRVDGHYQRPGRCAGIRRILGRAVQGGSHSPARARGLECRAVRGTRGSRWEREHQLEENKKRDRSNETTLFTHCDLHPSES